MNFQSLSIPPPRLREPRDPLRPVQKCGCNCIVACRCTCSCRDHCTCKAVCEGDCTAHASRNLVVSLDGAFNQFGAQNTNVAELHSRVLVESTHRQLTYYNCGMGTYASSDPGTFKDWFRRFHNAVDLAIGWNFKTVIVNAYRWLCDQYQPGDRIFLFGFSRGAYQVRILTAMIDNVGLVNAGNLELISSAYEIFLQSHGRKSDVRVVENFKSTFSRGVKVHFVGAWDTTPSAGLLGPKPHPFPSCAEHVCICRHALALDERRVKILSENIGGGSQAPFNLVQPAEDEKDDVASTETKIGTETKIAIDKGVDGCTVEEQDRDLEAKAKTNVRNVKEVWFAGRHAHLGGGLQPSIGLDLPSASLSWMEKEATSAGLRLSASNAQGRSKDVVTHSLNPLSRFLRIKPFFPKKYDRMTRPPHIGQHRLISPGQYVHASVAFMAKEYRPLATFLTDNDINWQDFVGQNLERTDFGWASRYGDRLEMDLLDASAVIEAVRNLKDLWDGDANSTREAHWIRRLSFMALSGNLALSYLSASRPVWDDDDELELGFAAEFFRKLAVQQPAIFNGDLAEILEAQGRMLDLRGKGAPDSLFEEALRIRRSAAAGTPATLSRRYKLAASLVWNGSYAVALHKPTKALYFFDEGLDVLRSLLTEKYPPALPLFTVLQRNFGTCLHEPGLNGDTDSALRVAETIVTLSRALAQAYTQYNPVLAAALYDLAFGFSEGRSFQEPNAAQESIALYRILANGDPHAYTAALSDALYNSSCRLLAAGQHEKALCASLEATQTRRKLEGKHSLATCLDQLSRCFRAAGKMRGALNAAEEAVRIRRKLAEEDRSWQSEGQLACSLSNLSCCLSTTTGRSENALHAAREAVSIQRGLARDIPAKTFNLQLSLFLHNFSIALSSVGRHEEALRAAEEALHLRTSWGDDTDCALSLSRIASCLRVVGRQDQAARMVDKCLDITRRLTLGEYVCASDLRTEVQLAETLFALSFCFTAEQASQAIDAATDSVVIYRRLTDPDSGAFNTALAGALLQLSSLLSSVGKDEEALHVAVEAVLFGRGLTKDFFSTCLYHLSLCLSNVGMPDEAVCPAQQCVEIRRELVTEYGAWQFKEQLADALFNLSLHFSHLHSSRALDCVREGVTVQRGLAGSIPADQFNQRLADGLQNLSARALLAGQCEEALRSADEAVNITRKLVEADPNLHRPGLVNVLYTQTNALCEYDRFEDAFRALSESDALRRTISSDSVFASPEASAAYMSTRARCITGLGEHSDGLCCLRDAIKFYREAFAASPASSAPRFDSFPWFLKNIFACASLLGRSCTEVSDVMAEVVELSKLLAGECPTKFNHCLEEAEGCMGLYQNQTDKDKTSCGI